MHRNDANSLAERERRLARRAIPVWVAAAFALVLISFAVFHITKYDKWMLPLTRAVYVSDFPSSASRGHHGQITWNSDSEFGLGETVWEITPHHIGKITITALPKNDEVYLLSLETRNYLHEANTKSSWLCMRQPDGKIEPLAGRFWYQGHELSRLYNISTVPIPEVLQLVAKAHFLPDIDVSSYEQELLHHATDIFMYQTGPAVITNTAGRTKARLHALEVISRYYETPSKAAHVNVSAVSIGKDLDAVLDLLEGYHYRSASINADRKVDFPFCLSHGVYLLSRITAFLMALLLPAYFYNRTVRQINYYRPDQLAITFTDDEIASALVAGPNRVWLLVTLLTTLPLLGCMIAIWIAHAPRFSFAETRVHYPILWEPWRWWIVCAAAISVMITAPLFSAIGTALVMRFGRRAPIRWGLYLLTPYIVYLYFLLIKFLGESWPSTHIMIYLTIANTIIAALFWFYWRHAAFFYKPLWQRHKRTVQDT